LIGRCASLSADAIIAGSSSGFTTGAVKKANRYGIIPRDLRELTDLEVKGWGRQVDLTLYFYQYSDLELSLYFKRESILRLDKDAVRSELTSYPGARWLFDAAARRLGTLNHLSGERARRKVDFDLLLEPAEFHLSGEPIVEVDFQGKACLISQKIISAAVLVYGKPDDKSVQRDVTAETFSLGETSIVHDAGRISVFLDISQVEMPPFCQFRFFRLAGEDEMDHEAIELVGLEKLFWIDWNRMNINICSI
jgi:hypothetical protein